MCALGNLDIMNGQLIFSANQLSGFYILETLLLNVLKGEEDLLGNFPDFYSHFLSLDITV